MLAGDFATFTVWSTIEYKPAIAALGGNVLRSSAISAKTAFSFGLITVKVACNELIKSGSVVEVILAISFLIP